LISRWAISKDHMQSESIPRVLDFPLSEPQISETPSNHESFQRSPNSILSILIIWNPVCQLTLNCRPFLSLSANMCFGDIFAFIPTIRIAVNNSIPLTDFLKRLHTVALESQTTTHSRRGLQRIPDNTHRVIRYRIIFRRSF
jgi:hypothetical protein